MFKSVPQTVPRAIHPTAHQKISKYFFSLMFPPAAAVTTPSQRKVGCGGHCGGRRFYKIFLEVQ